MGASADRSADRIGLCALAGYLVDGPSAGRLRPFFLNSASLAAISATRFGWAAATFFFSLRSVARLYEFTAHRRQVAVGDHFGRLSDFRLLASLRLVDAVAGDVLAVPLPQRQRGARIVLFDEVFATFPVGFSPRKRGKSLKRWTVHVGQSLSGKRREAGQQVHLADRRFDTPGAMWPGRRRSDHRAALRRLPDRALGAAQHAVAAVAVGGVRVADAVLFVGAVVIEDAAVVTGKDDECVLFQFQPRERVENLTHGPVELDDGIAADAAIAFAAKLRVWHTRNVDIVRRHFEEKRFVLVLLDERAALRGDHSRDVFIIPQRCLAASLFADSGTPLIKDCGSPHCTR